MSFIKLVSMRVDSIGHIILNALWCINPNQKLNSPLLIVLNKYNILIKKQLISPLSWSALVLMSEFPRILFLGQNLQHILVLLKKVLAYQNYCDCNVLLRTQSCFRLRWQLKFWYLSYLINNLISGSVVSYVLDSKLVHIAYGIVLMHLHMALCWCILSFHFVFKLMLVHMILSLHHWFIESLIIIYFTTSNNLFFPN